MIKKRLMKNADRSFRLIAAMLMRRAIGRLILIDEGSLSKAGLSRAAVAEFLEAPLGTDPHRFFRRRHAQDNLSQPVADQKPSATSANEGQAASRRSNDQASADLYHEQAAGTPRITTGSVRQSVSFRIRVLTAGVLAAVGALSACSGGAPDRDTAQLRRDPAARCRLRPDSFPLSPNSRPHTSSLRSAAIEQRTIGREARAGPV